MAFVDTDFNTNTGTTVKFLEIHCLLIDPNKRYIDLKKLTKNCEGYTEFGEWIESHGGVLECTATWMLCFTGQYVNLFHDTNLMWRLKDHSDHQPFVKVHELIYDEEAADLYRELSELSELKRN